MHDSSVISVIIPVYNVAPYVKQCLDSVLNQTYDNIEIIIVDDCGKDESMSIVETIKQNYYGPKKIKIVHHEKNRGLSAARNTGVDNSTGSFISFIDSDDFISQNMMEVMLKEIEKGEVGIVSCLPLYGKPGSYGVFYKEWEISEELVISPMDYAEMLLTCKTSHTAWGKLYRRDILINTKFREGQLNEDTLFVYDSMKYIEDNNVWLKILPQHFYYYRKTEGGICLTKKRPFYFTEYKNLKYIITSLDDKKKILAKELKKYLAKRVCQNMRWMLEGEESYNRGYYKELSGFLRIIKDDDVKEFFDVNEFRNYRGFKKFPLLYGQWYQRHFLHIKPTLVEMVRIQLGAFKSKLINR